MKKLPIKIHDIEDAFFFLGEMDPDYAETPVASFLDLETGVILNPQDEDEWEEMWGRETTLQLPNELFKEIDGYQLMLDFTATIENEQIRSEIENALIGKGAFRRFKDIVFYHKDASLPKRWRHFETRRQREEILDWLTRNDIDPQWDQDPFKPFAVESK